MGGRSRIDPRSTGVLIASNVLGGVGVASGVAVGGLLAEQLGGTSVAGLVQAAGVLGAAVSAVPLAALAARRGRRWSLASGYAIAVLGGGLVVTSAVVSSLLVLVLGLALFGVAQAVNLQSRYAAADGVAATSRGRVMSVVLWATTVGSVAGPNLTAVGARLGESVGVPGLAGPFLFSIAAFATAGAVIAVVFRAARAPAGPVERGAAPATPPPGAAAPATSAAAPTVGALAAVRRAAADPVLRLGVALLAVAHSVMLMVMVMTPLHMQHSGMSLELVGVVISLHVLGMYAFSPVFGWVADRWGPLRLAAGGCGTLVAAVVLGFVAAASPHSPGLTATTLVVLGLGWSAGIIAASAILATAPGEIRLPLQGATDAGMNYAGAAAAAVAGPILAAGGFRGVNLAAAVLLAPLVVLLLRALRVGPPASPGRSPGRERRDATRTA